MTENERNLLNDLAAAVHILLVESPLANTTLYKEARYSLDISLQKVDEERGVKQSG